MKLYSHLMGAARTRIKRQDATIDSYGYAKLDGSPAICFSFTLEDNRNYSVHLSKEEIERVVGAYNAHKHNLTEGGAS